MSLAPSRPRMMRRMPDHQLSAADTEKVLDSNACALSTLKIIELCDKYHLLWIVENPHTSKLWLLQEFAQLIASPHTQRSASLTFVFAPGHGGSARSSCLEMCLFRTWIGFPLHCQTPSGSCSFRHRGHFHDLTGAGPGNVPWTKLAQLYPPGLCKDLEHILSSSYMVLGQHPSSTWMLWG